MPALYPKDLSEAATRTIAGVNPGAVLDCVLAHGEVTLVVDARFIVPILTALRDEPRLSFTGLADVTAVDTLELGRPARFDVVYHLYSFEHAHRLRLRAPLAGEAGEFTIDSVCALWPGASFMEREAYDMFGIRFAGHPDLCRILMPDDWEGHPLRKDFPLGGAKSFYLKQDTDEYAGEPQDLIPRIRVQDGDV